MKYKLELLSERGYGSHAGTIISSAERARRFLELLKIAKAILLNVARRRLREHLADVSRQNQRPAGAAVRSNTALSDYLQCILTLMRSCKQSSDYSIGILRYQ